MLSQKPLFGVSLPWTESSYRHEMPSFRSHLDVVDKIWHSDIRCNQFRLHNKQSVAQCRRSEDKAKQWPDPPKSFFGVFSLCQM